MTKRRATRERKRANRLRRYARWRGPVRLFCDLIDLAILGRGGRLVREYAAGSA